MNIKLFYVDASNYSVKKIVNDEKFPSHCLVFAQIDISKWNYLKNYISIPNAYVYLYINPISPIEF